MSGRFLPRRHNQGVRWLGWAGMSLLLAGCTLQRDVVQAPPSGQLGQSAPALTGVSLDGQAMRVALKGHRTVVVFWASWCGPCRHEQPALNRLSAAYSGRGVQLVGVEILDRDRAGASAFERELDVPYPSFYDPDGKLAAAYEVDYPPGKVLVDQRGIIVARYPGEAAEGQLRALIEKKLLA